MGEQGRVLYKLFQHESLPQTAVLHELVQTRSLRHGAVLKEQIALAWTSSVG